MRIICAELKQESNSFAPHHTELRDFEAFYLRYGSDVEELLAHACTEMGGFYKVARREGIEMAPAMAAVAMSGGPVRRGAFEALVHELLTRIKALLPADGVLLSLHGAMLVEGLDDAEGVFLARLREAVGPIPVVATMDLHANLGLGQLEHVEAVVSFDTCPHTDLFETGVRAADTLIKIVRQQLKPRMVLVQVPMILPVEAVDTSVTGPAQALLQEAIQLRENEQVLSSSVFFVQPWLDVPKVRCAVLAVVTGPDERVIQSVAGIAQRMWDSRKAFRVEFHSVQEAVSLALNESGGPVVLSDSSDSIGAGAPGDATGIIRCLLDSLDRLPGDALTTVVDAQAAREAASVLPGEQLALTVGGKLDRKFNQPIKLDGVLRTVFHGDFCLSGPSFANLMMHMGLTAVVEVGRLKVVITSRRTWTHSPDFYRAVGLDPRQAKIVLTKSNTTFKASYELFAHRLLRVRASGVSDPDLVALPYQWRSKPLYPFEDFVWNPCPQLI